MPGTRWPSRQLLAYLLLAGTLAMACSDQEPLPLVDAAMLDQPRTVEATVDRPRADRLPEGPTADRPSAKGTCAARVPITLTGAKTTVVGNTTASKNEFPKAIRCGHSTFFDGPQIFYTLNLKAGLGYVITLYPKTGFDAALYAFRAATACEGSAIEAACTGYFSDVAAPSGAGVEKLHLLPATDQEWVLAVDSYSASQAGTFTLIIEEIVPPSHALCTGAKPMTMATGPVTIAGDTSSSLNEFGRTVGCHANPIRLRGPQLYYSFSLQKGQYYQITFNPQFSSAYIYLFPLASCSSSTLISTDCSSKGVSGQVMGPVTAGQSRSMYFMAPSSMTYILAVDSADLEIGGAFSVEVAPFTPATNGTCAAALPMSLVQGKAQVQGNTAGLVDEYPSLICGAYTSLVGPQAYYSFSASAQTTYKITLAPAFPAFMYLFNKASCGQASSVEVDCASKGNKGDYSGYIAQGGTGSLYYLTKAAGDFIVGVDSVSATNYGPFSLTVEVHTPAKNAACTASEPLVFSSGKATVKGVTTGAANEFMGLKCMGTFMSGPQLYYTLSAEAGKTYVLRLVPGFAAQLYLVSKSACGNPVTMAADCSSQGTTGHHLNVSPGSAGQLFFSPATAGDYLVVVDSSTATSYGAFTLEVREVVLPTVIAPFSWDFEASCMGLFATLDWECGVLAFSSGSGCHSPVHNPLTAHSGSRLWGTRLNDCYTPFGNNSESGCVASTTQDDSILSFDVVLPATWTQATLTYWAWDDTFVPFDWSEVRLDGVTVPASNTCQKAGYSPPTAWTQHAVDLSGYVGKTVTVAFHFSASTVTNYSGLYLDDIAVTGN